MLVGIYGVCMWGGGVGISLVGLGLFSFQVFFC
jgi:hypothetical protein